MPNELITSLRQDLSKIPSLIRRAEVAGTKLSKLETQYNNLKEDLAKIQKQKSVSVTDASTLEKTLVEAPKILWEQIRLAVKKGTLNSVFIFEASFICSQRILGASAMVFSKASPPETS